MKGMKGKLLTKLKSIRTNGYLKTVRVLRVSAADGYVFTSPLKSEAKDLVQFDYKDNEPKKIFYSRVQHVQEPEIIDVTELMKDLKDEEMDCDDGINDDKENISPEIDNKNPIFPKEIVDDWRNMEAQLSSGTKTEERKQTHLLEIDFHQPELDSGTVSEPKLLAAFKQAVMEVKAQEAEIKPRIEENNIQPETVDKARKIKENKNPPLDFKDKCPPGGTDSVVLYTTGLRGIRKTFENCNGIRFLLESFRVVFSERDVSMHSEFREEMWRILGAKVVPPRLFIKGRYIGGAEEVFGLHEQGKFRPLFEGIPTDQSHGPCEACGGVRFLVCFSCNGCRKVIPREQGTPAKCPECNENGLIVCPSCN